VCEVCLAIKDSLVCHPIILKANYNHETQPETNYHVKKKGKKRWVLFFHSPYTNCGQKPTGKIFNRLAISWEIECLWEGKLFNSFYGQSFVSVLWQETSLWGMEGEENLSEGSMKLTNLKLATQNLFCNSHLTHSSKPHACLICGE